MWLTLPLSLITDSLRFQGFPKNLSLTFHLQSFVRLISDFFHLWKSWSLPCLFQENFKFPFPSHFLFETGVSVLFLSVVDVFRGLSGTRLDHTLKGSLSPSFLQASPPFPHAPPLLDALSFLGLPRTSAFLINIFPPLFRRYKEG